LRSLRRYPSPDLTNWRNSSSGLDSPSESHLRATACVRIARPVAWSTNTSHAPRGLIPFDVFPAARSHIPPTDSQSIGSCCALRVSHPLDALLPARPIGLVSSRIRPWGSPFEAFILPQRRTPFSTSVPSWGSRWFRRISSPLQGYSTLREARPRKLGFSQSAVSYASLSFASSEVSCLLRSVSG